MCFRPEGQRTYKQNNNVKDNDDYYNTIGNDSDNMDSDIDDD